MKTISIASLSLLFTAAVHAGRTSVDYAITTDTADSGGHRSMSAGADYTTDGSVGGVVVGLSTATTPAETAKAGYIGQLYEVVGFALSDTHSSVPESSTLQLQPGHLLDDATLLAIAPDLVSWSVVSGPVSSISTAGLATSGTIYLDTPATVQGSFGAATASLNLTVLNVNSDDLDSYAGDGIGDEWQVQYFGLPPNSLAGPLLDPDGDTQDNLFEWNAGLDPTDVSSAFYFRMAGSFQGVHLIFGPTVPGRTYTVKYGFDLLDVTNWDDLPDGIVTDIGTERRVLDPNALFTNPRKFYRVEIEK